MRRWDVGTLGRWDVGTLGRWDVGTFKELKMIKRILKYYKIRIFASQSATEYRVPSTVYRLPSILLLLFLFGCQSGPDENRVAVDAFVKQEVEKRLATYKKILEQQCRDNVLEEAGRLADSILISEARLKRDSLLKPPKPEKPEKPEIKALKDSISLDPLFRDTTTN